MIVTPHRRLEGGSVVAGAPERHTLFLTGFHADTQGRHKFLGTIGTAAKRSCSYCRLEVSQIPAAASYLTAEVRNLSFAHGMPRCFWSLFGKWR